MPSCASRSERRPSSCRSVTVCRRSATRAGSSSPARARRSGTTAPAGGCGWRSTPPLPVPSSPRPSTRPSCGRTSAPPSISRRALDCRVPQTVESTMAASAERDPRSTGMGPLIAGLLRAYRGWLVIILFATGVETAVRLAAPWPLKIVLDQVIEGQEPPAWMGRVAAAMPGHGVMRLAALAAIATVLIAAVGALASYLNNYYTESVGQWVANDLRIRVYDHLEHLPLAYYDTHETGTLLSTITDDIATIQGFASSSTLGIAVDLLTIAGMLGLMFWLNWDFALVAVGVAPFLLLFVLRFRKAVRKATREVRVRESDMVGVVQQGLESIRVVNAFGRQQLEEEHLQDASRAAVQAALRARRVKSLLSPVVTVTVALCTAFVLWRGALLV